MKALELVNVPGILYLISKINSVRVSAGNRWHKGVIEERLMKGLLQRDEQS